jgi:trimethylamine:corrinoid methyltransferase-like protein
MGFHDSFEHWVSSGRHDLLEEARLKIEKILSTYPPNPPDEPVMRELQRIEKRARCR